MDNLTIYNAVRNVPPAALKEIQAGRLKGKSDINPMWRIKALTEQFGPCGIGWKYEITDKRLEKGGKDEIAAFMDINLYVKVDGEWSAAIPGTGGNMFVASESKGLYTSDECFKMALTDAISVACKALGVGADVYWNKDTTKYAPRQTEQPPATPPKLAPAPPKQSTPAPPPATKPVNLEPQRRKLFAMVKQLGWDTDTGKAFIQQETGKGSTKELTQPDFTKLFALLDEQLEAQNAAISAEMEGAM